MHSQQPFVLDRTLLEILNNIVIYHPANFNNINNVLKYINGQLKKISGVQLPDRQKSRLRKFINENNLEQSYRNCPQSDKRLNNINAQESKHRLELANEHIKTYSVLYKSRTL